jgi:SAM-dependent methyltransferase
MTGAHETKAAFFYTRIYLAPGYADCGAPESHYAFDELNRFIREFGLLDRKCLEVGCGRGAFQDLVADYTGVDLSGSVAPLFHKPFVACDAANLPFERESFDALWSITMLEHVPNPEAVLQEMRRVLRPGGLLYLKPAWHCRQWICEGIPIREYRELTLRQRWIKATLPIRNALPIRVAIAMPVRIVHWLRSMFVGRPRPLPFRRLHPDYGTFWMADSDAAVSLDPFELILWFRSRGDDVLSHPTLTAAFFSRHEPLIVRVSSIR